MCRLFALTAGTKRVHADFWLLDAPDSLELQSRLNHDGTGLGFFDESGRPVVDKQAAAAYSDVEFIQQSKSVESSTFVAHVRYATAGEPSVANTHPFASESAIMAHNGGLAELADLEAALGDGIGRIQGDTDSERFFGLISHCTERNGGDVTAAVVEAASWVSDTLPLFSLNIVLATENELWALRYPEYHRLFVLDRPRGGDDGGEALQQSSGTLGISSAHLADHPSVVIASEPMDESPRWRLMEPGELLHVTPDLTLESMIALPDAPRHFDASLDPQPYTP